MILASRLVLALLGGLGAYQAMASLHPSRWFSQPWSYLVWGAAVVVGVLLGLLFGGFIGSWLRGRIVAIERAADRRSAAELTIGALGLIVGLAAAALAAITVLKLPIVGPYLAFAVVPLVGYIFYRIAARKHMDIARLVGLRSRGTSVSIPPRLIDTSAIIDGRLVDVVKTRFMAGSIVVPTFVLDELHAISDSSDPQKRARGRRGLDLVEELKAAAGSQFSIRSGDYPEVDGVDAKLVRMATDVSGVIVTTDYNLNKVARIHGIDVLNLNDLANALKPAVLPGERLAVRVIREGKEYNQGVGYLDDGTMIVVEGGRSALNREVDVDVTSIIQSPSGKMIFTRLADAPVELQS